MIVLVKLILKEVRQQGGKITRADVAKTLVEVLESKLNKIKSLKLQGDTIIANAVRA
jgi:hypothetical protein